jgi:hypothetical protein
MSTIILNCIIVEGLTYTQVSEPIVSAETDASEDASCMGCAFFSRDLGRQAEAESLCAWVRKSTRVGRVQNCTMNNGIWVPAEYATRITNWGEALRFFDALQRMDQVFNPDDDPVDVHNAGEPVFYEPVSTMVKDRMTEARRHSPTPDDIYTELMNRS